MYCSHFVYEVHVKDLNPSPSPLCVFNQQVLIGQFPVDRILSPENLSRPWYSRFAVCYTCMLTTRMKYYFLWKVAEGTSILSGLGFKGYDNNGGADWSGISNVQIAAFEMASVSIKLLY